MSQAALFKLLNQEFTRSQANNPQYSLRAFAKRVGLQPSTLSRILSGKRAITRQTGKRILDRLCVDPQVSGDLIKQLKGRYDSRAPRTDSIIRYMQLSSDQFQAISEWYHLAIFSLAETPDFEMNPEWVAKRLGIKKQMAAQALERLKRMSLIVQNPEGKWKSNGEALTTSADIADVSIQKAHFQSLELARRSLEEDLLEERDFSFVTMAISRKKLPEAKKRIREFRRQLCEFLESGEKDEVYRMNVQLFPLCRKKSERKNRV